MFQARSVSKPQDKDRVNMKRVNQLKYGTEVISAVCQLIIKIMMMMMMNGRLLQRCARNVRPSDS